MHLKTIFNQVTDYKSFVLGKIAWREDAAIPTVDVEFKPRANGRAMCSGCGERRPGYDTMAIPRSFDFIPLWGIAIVLVYRMRRVSWDRVFEAVKQAVRPCTVRWPRISP